MAQLPDPAAAAAANVAAGKEETAGWEDALDLDDSDILFDPLPHSFGATASQSQPQQDKPPPHPSHHHHRRRIPGPAAAVQDTVLPRSVTRPPLTLGRGDARATDADFLRPPWLSALQFLGKDRAWERPGIRAIKGDEELLRAPLVAGVVTSCKPNGLGDLFLTLKDPTDSIGASVHKKVLLEENNGHDISIGSAVVFSKVAIFRPSHTKLCYLNVTKGKVVKVFSKDCAAPAKQVVSSSTTERSQGGDSTSNIMMKIFGREDMMPSNNEITVTKVSHEHHATPDSSNSASTWDISGGFSVRSNQEGKLLVGDPHKHMSSCSTDGHTQQNLSTPNTIGYFSTPKENVNTSSESLLKRKRAVSEWTEEQLSELSVDY